jgi:hypothetical protein
MNPPRLVDIRCTWAKGGNMTESTSSVGPKWETEAREAIRAGLRRFRKPLADLFERDANEGDTRLLVTDFLCETLGYDKYEDLTTEFSVRGEFADYGVRIEKQLVAFIEVKRVAQQLNARHLRQVETYAVKEGLEWVILTNGRAWQVYHVTAATGQQVATELVFDVDLLGDATPASKVDNLFHLHRAALKRHTIDELWTRRAATAPHAIADAVLSDKVIDELRSEIRRRTRVNSTPEVLRAVLRDEVFRPGLL